MVAHPDAPVGVGTNDPDCHPAQEGRHSLPPVYGNTSAVVEEPHPPGRGRQLRRSAPTRVAKEVLPLCLWAPRILCGGAAPQAKPRLSPSSIAFSGSCVRRATKKII